MQDVKTNTTNIKQIQVSSRQSKNNNYPQKNNFLQKILKTRELSLFLLVIFIVILLSILTPNFWQISNFKSIARGFFLEAIPLIGMTFLLVSGVFDLSVGSVMALSGYVTAALVVKGVPIYISCLAGLLTGVFAGYINGRIITFFGVNPLIMTYSSRIFKRIGYFKEITNYTPNLLLQKGLCFVPQGRNVFPLMTVAENIELGAFIKKNSKEIKNKIDYIYSIFPRLKNRKNQKTGSLSGGEMQTLEMGRALLLDPKLILLDEPSLGLSPLLVKEVFSLIVKINQYNHTAILMVEQNAEQSLRISHYAYVLEDGLNKCEGPAEMIRKDQKVKKLYLGG